MLLIRLMSITSDANIIEIIYFCQVLDHSLVHPMDGILKFFLKLGVSELGENHAAWGLPKEGGPSRILMRGPGSTC